MNLTTNTHPIIDHARHEGSRQPKVSPQGNQQQNEGNQATSSESIHLSGQISSSSLKLHRDFKLANYQSELRQTIDSLKAQLQHTLKEMGLMESTYLKVSLNETNEIKVDSYLTPDMANAIAAKLNSDELFTQRFKQLAQNQPTVSYLQNVTQINQAYNSPNNVFQQLMQRFQPGMSLGEVSRHLQSIVPASKAAITSFAFEFNGY
ncbi:hypothetical protein [Spartinivicinus ruber]|uniref:hypothetical protein n=1 Tax=Spartinivicinus ruber TaxID=2683272 RepID=UPI0013D473B1|nr:hypothetical protein [Spartinivicinus ruber]